MNATITLDQIIAASRTSGIAIADIIVGIDRAQSPAQTQPKAATIDKTEAEKDASMAAQPASTGQFGRINRLHVKLGLRTYRTYAAFQAVYPTMLDASRYYNDAK